jgi:cytochrome c551/c552
VNISDAGDSIHQNNLFVSSDFIRFDRAQQAMMGHQMISSVIMGQNLVASSDCKTCHKVAEKSIGPSFRQVAEKYAGKPEAPAYLAKKIIKGGAGVWGETAMAAHPTLKEADAAQIVQYVLSFGAKSPTKKSLPAAGKIATTVPDKETMRTSLAIQATYSDNGGAGIKPLSSSSAVYLRYNVLPAALLTDNSGFAVKDSTGMRYLTYPATDGWIKITGVDLAGIKNIELTSVGLAAYAALHAEARAGKMDGPVVGSVDIAAAKGNLIIPVQNSGNGVQDIYLVFKGTLAGARPLLMQVKFTLGDNKGNAIAKRP